MTFLTFFISGTELIRTDMNKLVAVSRNNVAARFEFSSDWDGITPLVAQFSKDENTCYDVLIENGECIVPWEVLENEGVLTITVFGGDLITTSSVNINVYGNGLVGGLVPTVASPSVYSEVVRLSGEIEADYNNMKSIMDTYENTVAESESSINAAKAEAQSSAENAAVSAAEAKLIEESIQGTITEIETAKTEAISEIDTAKDSAIEELENSKDELKEYVDNLKVTNDMIEDNEILPNKIKPYNCKVYRAWDKTDCKVDDVNNVIWYTGVKRMVTQNLKPAIPYDLSDACILLKLAVTNNTDSSFTIKVWGIAINTTSDSNGIISKTNSVSIGAGETKDIEFNFYVNNMTDSDNKHIILSASRYVEDFDMSVKSIVVVALSENEQPDVNEIRFFADGSEDKDYIVVQDLLYSEIEKLKNAIISMGGNI